MARIRRIRGIPIAPFTIYNCSAMTAKPKIKEITNMFRDSRNGTNGGNKLDYGSLERAAGKLKLKLKAKEIGTPVGITALTREKGSKNGIVN